MEVEGIQGQEESSRQWCQTLLRDEGQVEEKPLRFGHQEVPSDILKGTSFASIKY